MDTTVPPGRNYDKALDYIEPFFKNAGLWTQRIAIPKESAGGLEGRTFLLAHRRSPGRQRLIFYTHTDVVPAEGWDGFTPKIEDGKMYGRGTADNKGSIVALLMALERIKDKPIKYDLTAMVTVDEEVGHAQANEIRYIRPYVEPVKDAYFFSLDCEGGGVMVASLGGVSIEFKIKGKSAHQGRPKLGINAIEKAIPVMNAFMEMKQKVAQKRSRIPVPPGFGVEYMEPNLSITVIHGGVKSNIIPDECTVTVARRLIPEENVDEVEKEMMDVVRSFPDLQWESKIISRGPTVPTTFDEPVTDELSEIIKAVKGNSSGKIGLMGGQPFSPVSLEWKAKIFGTGVSGAAQNAHGINEFVYLKDIEDLAEIIVRFIT
jgi:succinyl-diaminopimelate desuccinylase